MLLFHTLHKLRATTQFGVSAQTASTSTSTVHKQSAQTTFTSTITSSVHKQLAQAEAECTSSFHALLTLNDFFVLLYSSSGGYINCTIIVQGVNRLEYIKKCTNHA